MLLDRYVTESDREFIQHENALKIFQYSKVRKEVRRWFSFFGFSFPHTSENNYRDSWFHYRKLYQEHSDYESTSQIATLDEHLQRAEKDSMIFLFQKVCESLEFWYFVALGMNSFNIDGIYHENALQLYDNSANRKSSWVYLLKDMCNNDIVQFSASCIYVAQKRIFSDRFKVETQKLVHEIKNNVLEVRMGGAQISRIDMPGDYCRLFIPYFNELKDFADRYRIIELLGATDIIERIAERSFRS